MAFFPTHHAESSLRGTRMIKPLYLLSSRRLADRETYNWLDRLVLTSYGSF